MFPAALVLSSGFLWGTPQASTPGIEYGIVVQQAMIAAGGAAQVDILLLPASQPVTALQFDIQYPDSALTLTATAGSALAAAQKTLVTSNPTTGTLRILITGMNRNEIPGGVIASLTVQASASAPGLYSLHPGNIAASNASGTAVYLFGGSGGVTIPGPVIVSAVNAASYAQGGVAPGEIVVISGSSLGPETIDTMVPISAGTVAKALDTTRVLFGGIAAPVIYTSAGQVSAVVPYALDGHSQTSLQVEYQGVQSASFPLQIVKSAPGVFTANAAGTGQAAIINAQDSSSNGPEHPAARGSVISIYGTGEGQTNPAGVDGYIVPASDLRNPVLAVAVLIDGQPAKILYAGSAGDQISGLFQLNVEVPATASTGSAVPVSIAVGGNSSQNGVTIAIQ